MILLEIVAAQLVVASVILFVLWKALRRELVRAALHALSETPEHGGIAVVSVLTAGALSAVEESELRALLVKKFPAAAVTIAVSRDIRGGLVIIAGDRVLDFSLLTRIKHLPGQADA